MDYSFASARTLYEEGVHPRVYLGPDDVPLLRAKTRRGRGRDLMRRLRQRVREVTDVVLDWADVPALVAGWNVDWKQPGTRVVFRLHDVALVGLLDENADAVEAVRRVLAACPRAEKVGRQGVRRLGHGGIGYIAPAFDLVCPHLSEPDRRAWRRWAYASGVKQKYKELGPSYYKSAGGNMLIDGMLGALATLLAIDGDPGVPPLEADWATFLSLFEATLNTAIGPDGYPEEDVGYGTAVAAALALLAEPLRRAGRFDVYTAAPRYARVGRAMLHFVQPWGEYLTNTGDHGDGFGNREFILPRLAAETRDPLLNWLCNTLSRPEGGIPPTADALFTLDDRTRSRPPARSRVDTAFRGRQRGIVSFRSGWADEDTFVVFDGSQRSPAGQGHAHASCGHFCLTALGDYFSIDTGRYNNEQTCHSVVLIDGKPGRTADGEWVAVQHAGRLIQFAPGPFCDYAAVDSSHQHNCFWAWRHIGLVKGRRAPAWVWVVDDINKANDWAEYWWQLQTSPENAIRTLKTSATLTGWRSGNHLDVHFALPAPREYPKPHRLVEITQDVVTPSAYKYIPNPHERAREVARPSDMIHGPGFVRPRLVAKIAGYNGRFMSVLVPRRKGAPRARVTRLPSLPASLAVRVTFPEVEDTLIFAHEHNMLEAADIVARGKWCLVRRARATGKVIDHALHDGTSLTVAGKPLPV